MRVLVLTLAVAGILASAGAAAAQIVEVAKPLETPADTGNNHQTTGGSEVGSRQYRYLMKVETLREKVVRTEAQDGGQLTPEHAVRLQHELDKLNHIYGKG